jgi:hypothetical protein
MRQYHFERFEIGVLVALPLFSAEFFEFAHGSERFDNWFFVIGRPLVGVDDHGFWTSVRDSWFTGTPVGNDDSEAGTPSPPLVAPLAAGAIQRHKKTHTLERVHGLGWC